MKEYGKRRNFLIIVSKRLDSWFIDMVKNLLDGNMDAQAYEDTLREMFGIHAYISFTLDKVVSNAVRQLQHLVTDEAGIECYDMFQTESKNNATGGYCATAVERHIVELIYQKRAERLLADENCMKIFVVCNRLKLLRNHSEFPTL